MGNPTKPTTYLNWTDGSGTKVTQPPAPQMLSGWTAGEPIPFQYLNWLFWITDQWIQYLDADTNVEASDVNINASMRLINGGNWSWALGTGTLTWSSAFNLAVPSIADADNQAAASSCVLSDGQVAYVSSNLPFSVLASTTNLSNQVGVAYTLGITVGMTVTGTGIPGSTTVSAINTSTNTLTISNNATVTGTPTLTFSSVGALTVAVATSSSLVLSPNTVIIARRVGSVVYLGVNATQMLLRDQESKLLSDLGYLNLLTVLAGENLTANQAVYLSPGTGVDSARTAGEAYRTDAGSANGAVRSQFIGFVITTATAGNPVTIVSDGFLPGFSALTAGAIYYLDPATLGGITATRPTTSNLYIAPIGVATSATNVDIAPTATSQIIAAVGVGLGSADTLAINPATQSPYSLTSGNNGQVLLVNSANGALTINLPNPAISANLIFTVKDKAGQFSGNNCTLHRFGSEMVENLAADFVMLANFGEWTFSCDATNWYISAR